MRLLLVEDDVQLADGIATDLRRAGFAVDTADNGIDAEFLGLEQIYDGVILDLGLPGKPGLDVLRSWRQQGVGTPVLILTARDSWTDRVSGLKSGADDYLGKPFHFEELWARIEALLRQADEWVEKLDAQDLGERRRGRPLSDSGAKARLYHAVAEAHPAQLANQFPAVGSLQAVLLRIASPPLRNPGVAEQRLQTPGGSQQSFAIERNFQMRVGPREE